MKQVLKLSTLLLILYFTSCQSETNDIKITDISIQNTTSLALSTKLKPIKYIALGDSYTIGQSVCETCSYPEQLKSRLYNLNNQNNFELNLIAQTGWTTSDLIRAINDQKPNQDYDLVTLLIGVNNQHQAIPFSIYEKEFPDLVNKAIQLAKGDKKNVMVISIPDYAFTPYGIGNKSISSEIETYNSFAKNYCTQNKVQFIFITDITKRGLTDPSLVARDGLHPSEKAYTLFVDVILPFAVSALQD